MTVILSQKVDGEGQKRTCSSTCHAAKLPACRCICGGIYHGISWGGRKLPRTVREADELAKESVKMKAMRIRERVRMRMRSRTMRNVVMKVAWSRSGNFLLEEFIEKEVA